MDLHLTVTPSEPVHVYVNGTLVCSVAVGLADTRDTLLAAVHAARGLRALPQLLRSLVAELARCGDLPDHVAQTRAKKEAAYQRGLVDGLLQRTVPHPYGPHVPPIPPEAGGLYDKAYWRGEAIARCLAQCGEGD